MNPNPSQQEAISKPLGATLKIAAGAGTGKTTVIADRYLKLVREDGVPPEEILALTFTKKAASEMRKRIFENIRQIGDGKLYRSLYKAAITNFHSFCNEIIRKNPGFFELHPDVQIASEVDLSRIRRHLSIAFEDGRITGLPDDIEEVGLGPAQVRTFFNFCMSAVEKARGMMMTPDELEAKVQEGDGLEYEQAVGVICALWRSYENELDRRKLIDFPAMISLVVRALEGNGELRKKYVGRYRCILVDEFQDTSAAQYELVRVLSGGDFAAVTVVGDEKQSIYRWRDARVENIRHFAGESVNLDVNYRSPQEILDLAHHFISLDEELGRSAVRLEADGGRCGQAITVYHPPEETGSSRQFEAEAIASWMEALVGKTQLGGVGGADGGEYGFGDFAILLRSLKPGSGLPFLERELKNRNIPFAVVGASASLESDVLATLMHVLSLLAFPGSVGSILYLLEGEPYSLCDADLMRLFRAAGDRKSGSGGRDDGGILDEGGLEAKDVLDYETIKHMGDCEVARRAGALLAMLDRLKKRMLHVDFTSFLWEAVEESCIFAELFARGGSDESAESVMKLISSLAKDLAFRKEENLYGAIEHLKVVTDRDARSPGIEVHMPEDKVKIMTVHQAKGLEFPVVVIPGISGWRVRADEFYLSKQRGLFSNRFSNRRMEDLEEAEDYARKKLQEERCLLYVAMTRAKRRLFVSSCRPEGEATGKGTGFFKEILACLKDNDIPFAELRSAPEAPKAPQSMPEDKLSGLNVEEAVESWKACRDYLSRHDGRKGRLKPVEFIDWRSLKAFTECNHRFYLARELSLKKPAGGASGSRGEERKGESGAISVPGLDPAELGKYVHAVLEEVMRLEPGRRAAFGKVMEETAVRFNFKAGVRKRIVEKVRPIIESFVSSPLGRSPGVEALEEPFYVRVGNAIFTGRIDRIDETENGRLVVDYKTGPGRDSIERDYAFQIQFYAWALGRVSSRAEVSGVICLLSSTPEVVEVDTSADAVRRIGQAAEELASAMEEGTFEASLGDACRDCDYRDYCRVYVKNALGNDLPS